MEIQKALIIIRHGNDIPKGVPFIENPQPNYPLPDSNDPKTPVRVSKTRLTKEGNSYGKVAGETQAKNLGNRLANWMKGKYHPIGRVLTQNPDDGKPESTPNPFCTIYPVIDPNLHPNVTQKPVDVEFYWDTNDLKAMRIFDDEDFSTLLCSTRQTIWGRKEYEDDKFIHHYPDEHTFMHHIVEESNNEIWKKLKHAPSKCRYIYVFTNFNESSLKFESLEVFTLHSDGIRPFQKGD